jgi:GTPase
MPIPVVAIIGRPNVGKSTLLNRLTGARRAITHDQAGTTRDPVHGLVEWGKHNFWLVDTAGLQSAGDELSAHIQEQAEQAATTADAIILVVDAGHIITTGDRQAARLALKTKKPVLLALNKIDTASSGPADQFVRLGIPNIIEISALNGRSTGDLLDRLARLIPVAPTPSRDRQLAISILGRPNVGKSSLFNAMVAKQVQDQTQGASQSIVSPTAGTTRDLNVSQIKYHGQTIELLDTAGVRKAGKIEPGIEKFSVLRTINAISASDVALIVIDADEPAVAGDQHIAGLAEEAGKGIILTVNKWDKIEKDSSSRRRFERLIQHHFQFVWWAPLVFTSATTGANVTRVFELAQAIHQRRQTKLSTSKLNQVIQALIAKHPPAGKGHRQPKINYATQIGTEPPTFALFTSYPNLIHFSYRRYLENGLREAFDFSGTPIRVEFRDKRPDKR